MSTTSKDISLLVTEAITEFDLEEVYVSDPVDVIVYNQYNLRPNLGTNDGQINDGEDLCNPIGYEPLEQQILDLYRAGDSLNAYLQDLYPNGVPTQEEETAEEDSQPLPYGMDEFDVYDLANTLMNKALSAQLEAQYNAAQIPPESKPVSQSATTPAGNATPSVDKPSSTG